MFNTFSNGSSQMDVHVSSDKMYIPQINIKKQKKNNNEHIKH